MIGLVQRVSGASVEVGGKRVASIGLGLLILVGVERGDTDREAARLFERIGNFRIFDDAAGRMNLSVGDAGGSLLFVPQFTLAADTAKGNRPGFSRAAEATEGERLFGVLVGLARQGAVPVATGVFGASMRVALCNEGPATFWLQA